MRVTIACGGTVELSYGMYEVIESPNFPGQYDDNLACYWYVTVPPGQRVLVTFDAFDVSLLFKLGQVKVCECT